MRYNAVLRNQGKLYTFNNTQEEFAELLATLCAGIRVRKQRAPTGEVDPGIKFDLNKIWEEHGWDNNAAGMDRVRIQWVLDNILRIYNKPEHIIEGYPNCPDSPGDFEQAPFEASLMDIAAFIAP